MNHNNGVVQFLNNLPAPGEVESKSLPFAITPWDIIKLQIKHIEINLRENECKTDQFRFISMGSEYLKSEACSLRNFSLLLFFQQSRLIV